MDIRNIVILTGAGVSAESGLATFRGPDGLWEGHRVEDVATPEAFAAIRRWSTPSTMRGERSLERSSPTPRIEALARLDAEWPGELLIVTQNVDDLHERAGSKRLLHMHGELTKGWCLACDERFAWDGPMGEGATCPVCSAQGQVRPDIVWFGEMPYDMDRIDDALQRLRPVRLDRHVGRGLSGRRVRPDRALLRREDAGDESRAEPGQLLCSTKAGRAGGRIGPEVGRGDSGRFSRPSPSPISR